MLNAVAWGELDVIVIDLPPGTGDIQISLAQRVNLSNAVVVSTPQDVALLDVVKALTMFDKAEVPVLGMIQNMAVWVCPDCGRSDHIFGEGGTAREAERRGLELLGKSLYLAIREGSDAGMPVVVAEPKSAHAAEYRKIAQRLIEKADLNPKLHKGEQCRSITKPTRLMNKRRHNCRHCSQGLRWKPASNPLPRRSAWQPRGGWRRLLQPGSGKPQYGDYPCA